MKVKTFVMIVGCFTLSVEEQGSGVGVCDESTCRYGGVCEYDAEGSHGCMCNFNCEAVRSVLYMLQCNIHAHAFRG